MSKFKVGDKVIFKGQVRIVENVNVYDRNLKGIAVVSQMFKEAYHKDYWLNEVDPNLWYENCAKENELKPANSVIIKEKLGIK